MKKVWTVAFVLACGCVTKDSEGCTGVNSEDAEEDLASKGVHAACIVDDSTDSQFLCSDETTRKLYRCAVTTRTKSKVKCIPWFPTE